MYPGPGVHQLAPSSATYCTPGTLFGGYIKQHSPVSLFLISNFHHFFVDFSETETKINNKLNSVRLTCHLFLNLFSFFAFQNIY